MYTHTHFGVFTLDLTRLLSQRLIYLLVHRQTNTRESSIQARLRKPKTQRAQTSPGSTISAQETTPTETTPTRERMRNAKPEWKESNFYTRVWCLARVVFLTQPGLICTIIAVALRLDLSSFLSKTSVSACVAPSQHAAAPMDASEFMRERNGPL